MALKGVLVAAGWFGALVATLVVRPANAAPIDVRMSFCEPFQDEDNARGYFAQPYRGPGYGNRDGTRGLKVFLAYHTINATDNVASAIAETNRIELCYRTTPTAIPICPGEGPWLVFDRAAGVGAINPFSVARGEATARPHNPQQLDRLYPFCVEGDPERCTDDLIVPVDWKGGADALLVFPAVNGVGTGSTASDAAAFQHNGYCGNFRLLTEDTAGGRMLFFGRTQATPESCNGGRIDRVVGPIGPGDVPCVTDDQATWVRDVLLSYDTSQQLRLQASLQQTDPLSPSDLENLSADRRVLAWANGRSATDTVRPFHVFIDPSNNNGGFTTAGSFRLNAAAYRDIVPGTPPDTAIPVDACGILSTTGHEYFHALVGAWSRERPASAPHAGLYNEAMAALVGWQLCPTDFPDAPTTEQCVSAKRYGACGESGETLTMFRIPDQTTVNIPYEGLFWDYVGEQFAYPVGVQGLGGVVPHPAAVSTTIQRANNADGLALTDRPFSDEGMDIIGHLFRTFAETGSGVSTYDASSTALESVLGRSFADVVFDFHTALYLKDYTETDARWRFQWTHKDGFRSTTRLIDGKPFEVPSDLNGPTCDVAGTGTICDGLLRAHRAHDSWTRSCSPGPRGSCTGAAVRDLMGVADTVRSSTPVELAPYATTALSVSLAQPEWGNSGLPSTVDGHLAFQAQVLDGSPLRFRVFRVDGGGVTGPLTPTPLCPGSMHECEATPSPSSGALQFATSIPVSTNTREVLVVASSGDGSSKFNWRFGRSGTTLRILSPQTFKPTFVGHPDTLERAFLIELVAQDELGQPYSISKEDLRIGIDGCASTSGCVLGSDDFSLLPLSGGNHFIVATLPPSFFPPATSGSGSFGLFVSADGFDAPASAPRALSYGPDPHTQATVFVLDKSPSMSDFDKAPAQQIVARALVESMMPINDGDAPTNQMAIVSFDQDADTNLTFTAVSELHRNAIEGALGTVFPIPVVSRSTSIGDGVLEAQSVLASAFDTAMTVPDELAMIVMSDGLQNADALTSLYYDPAITPPNDGRGDPWYPGLLNWPARVGAGLRVPDITAIALGQDASNAEMDRLARLSDGEVIALPGPDSATDLRSQTLSMADLFTSAFNRVSDYDRVAAAVVVGSSGSEPPVARIAATSVARGSVTIPVDPDASELRVTVVSAFPGHAVGELRPPAPSTVVYAPTSTSASGDVAAFRVASPSDGMWTFTSFAPEASGEAVFVEATVRSPVELFTSVDVAATPKPPADPTPPERTDVFIRAVPFEAGPMLGCAASAVVTNPGFPASYSLPLLDDGKHQDGTAGDGIYGALVWRTSVPGAYDVSMHVECISARTGKLVVREGRGSFVIADSPDGDGDGMADDWEDNVGLDRRVNDCLGDPDGDGLTNCGEFIFGTHPRRPDTDFGGESDGSEFFGKRNGRDPSDDIGSTAHPTVHPGNGKACLSLDMSTNGLAVFVERASSAAGPFTTVATLPAGASFWCDEGRPNGSDACYRVRVQNGPSINAPSEPTCTRPAEDPYPPRLVPGPMPPRSCSRDVTIALRVEDTRPGTHAQGLPEELGVVDSPVEEMRWWFGVDPAPADAPWEPLRTSFSVRLPDLPAAAVSVQVRDRAGNEGQPLIVSFHGCRGMAIGRAIAAEERAEDLLATHDVRGAKRAVEESIEEIGRQLHALFGEVRHGRHPSRDVIELGRKLYRILALKIRVKHLLDERDCDRDFHGWSWGNHDDQWGRGHRWDHDRGGHRFCPPSGREIAEARRKLGIALDLENQAFKLAESAGISLK